MLVDYVNNTLFCYNDFVINHIAKYAIEIENLHKSYKDVEALKVISFSVLEGTLFSYIRLN